MLGIESGSMEASSSSRPDLVFHRRWNSIADILPGAVRVCGLARGVGAGVEIAEDEAPKLSAEAVFLAAILVVGMTVDCSVCDVAAAEDV